MCVCVLPVSRTGGQFLMSTVAMASLERSSLQMTAVVITQAEWLTCRVTITGVQPQPNLPPQLTERKNGPTSTIIFTVGRVVEMF